jgi:hypothetical protein
MWPAMRPIQKTSTEEMRLLFWAVVLAAGAALLLLLALHGGFQSIDRVLPPGEPFHPYFTT